MNSAGGIFTGNGGNETNPIVANVSDTNTGFFYPAADTIAFTTGGSEALRIDSNGNIGVNCSPATSSTIYDTVDHFIAIGDSDTGIAQDGDGQLELWANNQEIANFNTGQVTLEKVTLIKNSLGLGVLPATSGSGTQFGARTYKMCIGDNDTGISQNGDGILCFHTNQDERLRIDNSGNVTPGANSSQDLGSTTYRWNNIYSADLQLSNETKKDTGGNDVDGTWGDFTIQEGESDLFLINNRNGKKYKFLLQEVS